MGSQNRQGELWGKGAKDWASIQEATCYGGYEYALEYLNFISGKTLLDIGCGSGLFSHLAQAEGALVTGIDACGPLIDEAKKRNSSIRFLTGEMEELPFEDNVFDIVCGFNSFQYAEDYRNALLESRRVLKKGGMLVLMIWGNKEDCEAVSYLNAIGSLLPPSITVAPGPFALSENRMLENSLEETGFKILDNTDVQSNWDYQNSDVALKGLISTGPVARAIENIGYDKVFETISAAIQPYIYKNGHVVFKNKFRVIISKK